MNQIDSMAPPLPAFMTPPTDMFNGMFGDMSQVSMG